LVGRVNDRARNRNEERLYQQIALFNVPAIPKNWLGPRSHRNLDLSLTKQEATFLQRALIGIDPPCLLSEAAKLVRTHRAKISNNLWEDSLLRKAAKPLRLTQVLERAHLASMLAKMVRAVYGALVERIFLETTRDKLKSEIKDKQHYLNKLKSFWERDDADTVRLALALDVDELAQDIPTLPPYLKDLLHYLQERLAKVGKAANVEKVLLDDEVREKFEKVERDRKGPRARLRDTPAGFERRVGFGKNTVTVERLEYRWKQVRKILIDLRDGLRGQ